VAAEQRAERASAAAVAAGSLLTGTPSSFAACAGVTLCPFAFVLASATYHFPVAGS
jgi:hypothetical protein